MKRSIAVLAALLFAAPVALAVPPSTMNYQGQLFLNGDPTTGPLAITFRMFDAATAGTELWTETDNVTVTAGLFQTTLGDGTAFPATLFSAQVPWLEMEVNGTVLGPRTQFNSVPYALNVPSPGGTGPWSTDGTNVWRGSGLVGIGTTSPGNTLEIKGAGPGERGINIRETDDGGVAVVLNANDDRGYLQLLQGNATKLELNASPGAPQYFNNGGNVGIGTSTPNHPLEVHGSQQGQVGYFHSTSTSGTNYGVDAGAQGVGAATNIGGYFYASGAVNNYAIIVPPDYGKTGLGTTTPDAMLDVRGSVEVTDDGASPDTRLYASFGVTRSAAATNNSYIGLTKQSTVPWGLGIGSGEDFIIGTANTLRQIPAPRLIISYGGTVTIPGSLNVGGTKCREVNDPVYGKLYYNAVESGSAIFTTSGRAKLENGTAQIELDPKWLAGVTINNRHPLDVTSIVFYGPHGSWYATPGKGGFAITESTGADVAFFWTVQASQKGFEDLSLNRPEPTTAK